MTTTLHSPRASMHLFKSLVVFAIILGATLANTEANLEGVTTITSSNKKKNFDEATLLRNGARGRDLDQSGNDQHRALMMKMKSSSSASSADSKDHGRSSKKTTNSKDGRSMSKKTLYCIPRDASTSHSRYGSKSKKASDSNDGSSSKKRTYYKHGRKSKKTSDSKDRSTSKKTIGRIPFCDDVPTSYPTTSYPTFQPTDDDRGGETATPTSFPTKFPTTFTNLPTLLPTSIDTNTATPTVFQTVFPTSFPTNVPTLLPTSTDNTATTSPTASSTTQAITELPTSFPTSIPTLILNIETLLPTSFDSCPYVRCDFANLDPGHFMSKDTQRAQLLADCGLVVRAAMNNGAARDVNVFDSAKKVAKRASFDPDLGSPNQRCPGGGPGRGVGGWPNSPFPNCDAQGNLLVIQDPRRPEAMPNDNRNGGCLTFSVQGGTLDLVNMGLLDVKEAVSITVKADNNVALPPFFSPSNVGTNGFWSMNSTEDLTDATNVDEIKVCFPDSGAVSYLEYFLCPVDVLQIETSLPTTLPTVAPTMSPKTCSIINCDFSMLRVGVELGNELQQQELMQSCYVKVRSTRMLNIFDSSFIRGRGARYDPDLGSPNKACPGGGGGPGRGSGGRPESQYSNCNPQGNLLIIQNENYPPSIPNDSPYGGCMVFEFLASQPVSLLNFGLLDIDEDSVTTITVNNNDMMMSFDRPSNIGENGLWIANKTHNVAQYDSVKEMEVCRPGSGAVSFLQFEACI